MLRLCVKHRRFSHFPLPRHHQLLRQFSSSSSKNPIEPHNNLKIPYQVPPQSPIIRHTIPLSPLSTPSLSRNALLFLSATTVSALVAIYVVHTSDDDLKASNPLYAGIDHAVNKASESSKRIFHHIKQTGVAASVLWQSLRSILSSANHDVRSGFELRVAALLADIASANASRRASIVGAGGGAVVDWLLESVAFPRNGFATQSESARALAYLISDPNVSSEVLGRPGAIPNLLRFIFSCQPQRSKKQSRRSSFDVSDSLKGRSMLVAAIMDVVTSNCDSIEKLAFKPSLPGNAQTRDVAAAIQVIEEGGMHLDESHEDQEDGGNGMSGIGIKVLGGKTTVIGLSRTSCPMKLGDFDTSLMELNRFIPANLELKNKQETAFVLNNLSSAVVPGLWDDLHCEHVAVPFATWALANWAMASDANRLHIQELDQDGMAVMTALVAPERSVKWHGSLVARLLLEDGNIPVNDYISDWSSSLLSTVSQAIKNEDIPLAQMALSAFLLSVERSSESQKMVMEKGLHLMREIAKQTTKHKHVQEALAKALELVSSGDMHLSIQESQKWSGILLPWVFGRSSSEAIRSSAIRILSSILEDHGPASIPISQAWLALLLSEILSSNKVSSVNGNTQLKNNNMKTKMEQTNITTATQSANQLAGAVVNLAGNQLGTNVDSVETFPLADLLSLEPFTMPYKNLKKNSVPKLDVADSAIATLKGIKALAEICNDDSSCQEKITNYGVLCLLRRLLLHDDYEKLAAIEAYDASRILEAQERTANASGESSTTAANDPSSLRVAPTAHIRRHAARLLTILSLLPKVQKVILADKEWFKWLEDCANGNIPGCGDLKMQSYARASLSNIFCCYENRRDSIFSDISDEGFAKQRKTCPQYYDMIFLINPELSHWKCDETVHQDTSQKQGSSFAESVSIDSENQSLNSPSHGSYLSSSDLSDKRSKMQESSLLDVVFVHGLRGGPFKTWRISEDKSSSKSGLVEKIDEEAGKLGTFWPGEWLSDDLPQARLFTLKYKSNLTQWSGASLPLQEVSSMLLKKLLAAGIGDRPVVFVTHSMGGLVVKQMLYNARTEKLDNFLKNTVGVVFYSCPHFGSKLADMPMRIGLVLRPAPTIGELRSGSPRLVELNDLMRCLHKKGLLDVLSFCETKVTPIVEGYGGWAFRMEIVPIESAYPGFGELVVLESTDHINSCKPLSRTDASYAETMKFLQKLKTHRNERRLVQ